MNKTLTQVFDTDLSISKDKFGNQKIMIDKVRFAKACSTESRNGPIKEKNRLVERKWL